MFDRKIKSENDNLRQQIASLQLQLQNAQNQIQSMQTPEFKNKQYLEEQINQLNTRFTQLNNQCQDAGNQLINLQKQCKKQEKQIVINDETILLQSFGIYEPTYEFANSDLYKEHLKIVRDHQKLMIKNGTAAGGNMNWTLNGSQKDGKKMVADFQKLLIRAFNSECDSIIAKVKYSNFEQSKKRITQSRDTISKLGKIMNIVITRPYYDLKIQELTLAFEYSLKKQEEKERIKEARERQREEAKIQKEIEEQRKKLLKEQTHYRNALAVINEQLQQHPNDIDLLTKQRELQANISDTEKAIADVDYREANKRAGYVYVISNIGAFGKDIYKIGMTRRLEPQDRIDELSSASVPFNFDVHALIFTEDAPGLEAALHHAFENKKVNKINSRREFFRVSLNEIKTEVRKNFDKTVEWVDFPEAEQFRQSILQGGSAEIQDATNDVIATRRSENNTSVKNNAAQPIQRSKKQSQNPSTPIQKPVSRQPKSVPSQHPQIPDHYCICCKRSGKFMQVNEEHFCQMCADTATDEQKLNAKREAGLI